MVAGNLVQRGAGTERIFEEVQQLFPGVEVARLDRDAVDDIEKYRAVLADMRSGKTSIIVGTQMIAKGHDLPGVTLVGIVDCDVGLHMPDFRAGERIFQLLTQASGRAGRAQKPGRVILQTRVPRHISIVSTLTKDFTGFAKHELASRRSLAYPPFSRLLRIVASSQDKDLASGVLAEMTNQARAYQATHDLKVSILGPSPAPIEKLKTHYRWHVLLRSPSATSLNRLMKIFQGMAPRTTRLRLSYDMDPQDML
jgi:primosomal protein N' (replication factor Y)